MSREPEADEQASHPWVERYRVLRLRIERLEAIYDDREKLEAIIRQGRYLKLADVTVRAYRQIEREFAWMRREDGQA
ncbi:MAG: hypothetical protein ACK5JM_12290 [Rhodoblastus sp.]